MNRLARLMGAALAPSLHVNAIARYRSFQAKLSAMGCDSATKKTIVEKCSKIGVGEEGLKVVLQVYAKGQIEWCDFISTLEHAPGLIERPAQFRLKLCGGPVPWGDFVLGLRESDD